MSSIKEFHQSPTEWRVRGDFLSVLLAVDYPFYGNDYRNKSSAIHLIALTAALAFNLITLRSTCSLHSPFTAQLIFIRQNWELSETQHIIQELYK